MVENEDVTSAAKFMAIGLDLAGFKNWRDCNENTNLGRFRGRYGPSPMTCENIWDDLQTSTNEACCINNSIVKHPHLLLLAL